MVGPSVAVALLSVVSGVLASDIDTRAPQDACAIIGGQKWVAPKDLRACFQSFKVDKAIKSNILEVVNKTLAFHTSVSYQIRAPEPFTSSVHEDILADLARIGRQQYKSDYDLHIDLSRSVKRLNDGHCVWINSCYDSLFLNFIPTPLSLLTDTDGSQSVHISPEAFTVATAEFPDEIDFWQNALPGGLKGQLASLSGAKVLRINGRDPWAAVNANAAIAGSYQALGTRQNGFFSSYVRADTTWNYNMGQFAQQSLPLDDSVTLTIQRVNHTRIETVTIPYRARIGAATVNFTDSASYRANNCVAVLGTNGFDVYASAKSADDTSNRPVEKFQQAPPTPKAPKKQRLNVMLDSTPLSDVLLPPPLQPPAAPVNGSFGVGQFYMQPDGKTGVLALGSFAGAAEYDDMLNGLLEGLLTLKSLGATQLIVDVANNGGGFICIAHWLHRIIIGPKSTTVPQAGLDTKARAGPLATKIVQAIIDGDLDPDLQLLYNPLQWRNANLTFFGPDENWLVPPVKTVINGKQDAFSQRLGQECQPEGFTATPPDTALFEPSKVVIVSNGRCASSCSLFSVTMAKEDGVRTVVIGGKEDVTQQYCGIVGGQSTDFSTMDTEVKTSHLKDDPLAPPDLVVNGVQGITWRLGFGIENKEEPEEWQTRPATLNLPLTPALVNNPAAIWTEVTARLLSG